ncbi:MAG: ABC transporter substrate-binding protein [Acidobacteria bacterium]|nr:ABC transporter substrate-binding protein [Acidobacteriota bacterium]
MVSHPTSAHRRSVLLVAVLAALWGTSLVGGIEAQVARPPQRIVSLVPATTEMLFAIGTGPRVIGVGSYDRYPPDVNTRPKLGGLLDPNIEQLIALRPDLVIAYDTQTELRRQLERANIPAWTYSIKGLADVTSTMRALGDRIGMKADAAAAAARIEDDLRRVQARVAGRPRPRTLVVFGREPGTLRGINASGGYGFLHDLLELAGGTDVLADIAKPAVQMSTEMVLARAPDVIIELHYGQPWPAARADAERRVWSVLPSVPAVRSSRVHLLAGDEFVVPGPRVTLAAERLARALHPDAFR